MQTLSSGAQIAPAAQSALDMQLVLQPPVGLHAYLPQETTGGTLHMGAAPLQVPAATKLLLPMQKGALQTVPAAVAPHAPAPSYTPVVQVPATHVLCGLVPAGAGVQVPSEPGLLHTEQPVPEHALLQHTPSTQKLEAQAAFVEHACPSMARIGAPPSRSSKSTGTVAEPSRRSSRGTVTTVPSLSTSTAGSLIQVGSVDDATAAQALG